MATANRDTAANKDVARQVPEQLATERDLDMVDTLFAEDAVEHDPFGDYTGREEIREHLEGVLSAFPDMTATVEQIVAEGDTVAMWITLRGTHEGEMADLGLEPTGKSVAVKNAVFTRIEDGKIAERWVQPDMLGLVRQLGVEL